LHANGFAEDKRDFLINNSSKQTLRYFYLEIAGLPFPISIASGFSGKFVIKLVKMASLHINQKSDI